MAAAFAVLCPQSSHRGWSSSEGRKTPITQTATLPHSPATSGSERHADLPEVEKA